MRSLVFDTGPIISLTTNNLLGILEPLKDNFRGSFVLPESVRKEIIDKPLATKKFKFEALQVQSLIEKGIFEVVKHESVHKEAKRLLDLANRSFYARKNPLRLFQFAEMECLTLVARDNAAACIVDERITRSLVENPKALERLLERRLHTDVRLDRKNLRAVREQLRHVAIIRSAELVTIAYELGVLDKYLVNIQKPRRALLESVLWGVKLNGCALTEKEINQILRSELKR